MGNGMNKILPGLYVGNYRDSKDAIQLDQHNITHIIAIHDSARRLHADKHYLCVLASDNPDQNLSQYFTVCNDFIHAARLRGGSVLIHCLAGMSRSVTVAVAYIMCVTELTWKDALKVVRTKRCIANPNIGFQKQLQEFEETRVEEERRRLKERFPSLALLALDLEQTRASLASYDKLLQNKEICDGLCASRGGGCPTGICTPRPRRSSARRKSSNTASPSASSATTQARMLPATPTASSSASNSTMVARSVAPAYSSVSLNSLGRRPGSAGSSPFRSYTGGSSCPSSRTNSRMDVRELPPLVSSRSSSSGSLNPRLQQRINSAPGTPLAGSPVHSPAHRKTAPLRKAISTVTIENTFAL